MTNGSMSIPPTYKLATLSPSFHSFACTRFKGGEKGSNRKKHTQKEKKRHNEGGEGGVKTGVEEC